MKHVLRRSRRILLCTVAVCAAAGLEIGHAEEGVTAGTLAFSSVREGNEDIYVVEADGSGLHRLTTHPTQESEPCWSPDGQHIAYQSRRPHWEIYTCSADGTNERRVTDHLSWSPNWSGDGEWIIYSTGNSIRRVSSLGEGVTTLSSDPNSGRPAWSPDGDSIAFHSNRSGDLDVHVMKANGDDLHSLAVSPGRDFHASWSPDGNRIVFASDRDGDFEIFAMNVDGSNLVQLTDNEVEDILPAWSPDGARIAFVSQRDGNREIYVMAADGARAQRLTDNPGDDMFPAWKPSALAERG